MRTCCIEWMSNEYGTGCHQPEKKGTAKNHLRKGSERVNGDKRPKNRGYTKLKKKWREGCESKDAKSYIYIILMMFFFSIIKPQYYYY